MWKWIAIGLGVLIVVVGIGLVVLQEVGMAMLYKPDAEFAEHEPWPAPDYTDPKSWSALPGRDDAADTLPEGVEAVPEAQRLADVFYVHPTVNFGTDRWNGKVGDPELDMLVDQLPVKSQASAFNGCCRVSAPRYRQATFYTFMEDKPSNIAAIDLAYQDVARAFDYFVGTLEPGRPIILASHSQGSHHLARLLAERVSGTAIAERVVAVYMIGIGFPVEAIAKNAPDFPVCQSADDTGCIIHWDTYWENGNPDINYRGLPKWIDGQYQHPEDATGVCVNPLTWTDAKGEKSDHAGAGRVDPGAFADVFTGGSAPEAGSESHLGPIIPNLTEAWCARGFLWVPDNDHEAFQTLRIPGGSLHLLDYALFWKDIHDNASVRVNAFIAAQANALR